MQSVQTPSAGLLARSVTSAATITTRTGTSDASSPTESTIDDYNYQTSRIVRIAVISGVIVLVITALVLFFKITSWARYRQRQRRQNALNRDLRNEQRANAYEIAAWADEPGTAPTRIDHKDTEKRKGKKMSKRGAANAYNVTEWEGKAQ